MLNRSETWRQLASNESILIDTRITINETTYDDVLVPAVTRALMPDSVSIGNAIAAMCTFSLTSDNVIPRSAEVLMEMRLTTGGDEPTVSEWLPAGTFFLSRRTKDPINGIVAFECYDSMLKANAPWNTEGLTFPVAMNVAAQHIATLIGVEIDERTTIATGVAYMIDEPAEGTLMRDILATIAGYNGGNWIITPENKLRLVPVIDAADAEAAEDDVLDVTATIGSVIAENMSTITGIRCNYGDGLNFLVGDETGIVVDAAIPAAIATELAETMIGKSYQMFSLNDSFYDPAVELGDYIRYYDDVSSVVYSETITYDGAAQGTLSAPDSQEIADEYPYYGQTPKTLAVAKAYAEQAAQRLSDSLTQEDVFNRLTGNGAAQGLFLTQDGQLYVNASYIYSGTLTLGGLNNQNGTMVVKDASGNIVGSMTKDGISINSGSIISYSADKSYRSLLDVGQISAEGYLPSQSSSTVEWRRLFALRNTLGTTPEGSTTLLQGAGNIYIQPGETNSVTISGGYIVATNKFYTINVSSVSGIRVTGPFKVNLGSGSADELDIASNGTISIGRPANWRSALGITPANIGAYGVNSINVSGGLNDNTLYGTAWVNGADVSTLPTTDYYELMCFGNVQLALQYNGSNPSILYRRYYVNSQWYGWKPVVGLSTSIQINTASWSDIYAKLSVVEGGKSAFFWITDGTVASFISGRSDLAWTSGYVTNVGSGGYRFSAFNASGISYTWVISGLTSASATATVGTVSRSAYDIDLYNNSTSEAVYNELIKIPLHSSGVFTISSTTFGLLTQNKVTNGGGANVVNGTGTVSHVVHTSTSDTFKITCSGGTTTMPGYMFQWNVTLSKSGTTYTITADNVYGFQYAKAYT